MMGRVIPPRAPKVSLGPSVRELVQQRDELLQALRAIARLHEDDTDAAPAIARGALRGIDG